MIHHRIVLMLLGGLLVVASGCSGRKPVQAIVTLDGKAVEGATVVLTKEGSPPITGQTGSDGTVMLDSATKEGIPPGDYKVVVTKFASTESGIIKPGSPESFKMMKKGADKTKSELPAKYDNAKSTPLTLKIPPDAVPAKIELTK